MYQYTYIVHIIYIILYIYIYIIYIYYIVHIYYVSIYIYRIAREKPVLVQNSEFHAMQSSAKHIHIYIYSICLADDCIA